MAGAKDGQEEGCNKRRQPGKSGFVFTLFDQGIPENVNRGRKQNEDKNTRRHRFPFREEQPLDPTADERRGEDTC
jgi:hypothetical protein